MLRAATFMATFALLLLAGCGESKKAVVVHHPQWDYTRYKRVAVVPLKSDDLRGTEAARQAEYLLVDLLAGNGAFTVLTRTDLATVMTEQDLARLSDVADPATAIPEGTIQVAEALIIPRISTFDLAAERKELRRPRYARDQKGRIIRDRSGRPRVVGEDVIQEFRHKALVGGNVRILDVATGQIMLSHSVPPIANEEQQWGSPPRATPEELAVRAAKELAVDFYKRVAPVATDVKLKSDMLIIALEYYEGRYEKTKKVPRTLDQFLLVVRDLPSACDRNSFRVTIAAEEGREYLFEEEFVWSGSRGQRGFVFPVSVAKLADAGGEKFVAKLFAAGDDAPVMEREFELVAPEKED
ncbi:MAG: CsgG/HfaB family protein [Planctomycetes bacterium]|nr:CsgG/HfaB family protein [Planctomycetota bacterium]